MRHRPRLLTLAGLAGAVLGAWLVPSTFGAFTARITNSGSSAGTGATLLTAKDVGSNVLCATTTTATIGAGHTATCTGSTLPASVASSGTSSGSVTLSSSGSASPSTASLTAGSCGPVSLANQTASGDPMLARGSMSFAQSGPLSGSSAIGLDGSSALGSDITQTTGVDLLGSAGFTEGIWFKVANGYSGGGALLGLDSSPSTVGNTSSSNVMSLTTGGNITVTIPLVLGAQATLTSPGTYNDGHWHFAAVAAAGLVLGGAELYVDGTGVQFLGSLSLLTGYSGYWHAGWSPVASGSPYLTGSLANAFVIANTALSAAKVSALNSVASEASWNSTLATDGATDSWNLGDSGTTTYSGTLPSIGATNPCSLVAVAVSGPSYCVYSPNATSGACATPTATSATLAQWVAAGAESFPATATGTSTTITTSTIRGSSYDTTFMPGLRLYVPVTITERLGAGSSWYTTLSWTAASQAVIA